MSTVGNNIARLRRRLGWTQEELAVKMGYKSKSTINKIELGINDIPQSKIVKFAEVMHTTPAQLMGWEEKKPPDEKELSEGERMILEIFRLIPEDQQQYFLEMGRVYANSLKKD